MNKKVHDAAREILELRAKYTNREIDEAFALLEEVSGDSRIKSSLFDLAPRKAKKSVGSTSSGRSVQDRVASILDAVGGSSPISRFLASFIDKEILINANAVRDFAELIGLALPKKLPGRLVLAERFATGLAELDKERLDAILAEARTFDKEESSLRLWSDVITRGSSAAENRKKGS